MLDVPETKMGNLRAGETVELRSPAYPDRTFPGRVDNVGAFLDPQTRVAHAKVSVDNPDGLLKGEMYVSVEVKAPADTLTDLEMPARAVIYEDGRYYVFAQVAPRKFERREVALEREAGPDGASDVVVRGLPAGLSVVAQGSLLLNDAMTDDASGTAEATPVPEINPMPANGDPVPVGSTPRPL